VSWPTHDAVLAPPSHAHSISAFACKIFGEMYRGKPRFPLCSRQATRYFSGSNVVDVNNRLDAAAPICGMRDAWFEQRWLYR
jgi:hypothetical protein